VISYQQQTAILDTPSTTPVMSHWFDYSLPSSSLTSSSASSSSNASLCVQRHTADLVKVLYLFQCFQEAQDDNLCDILSKSFDSGRIDLNEHKLLPHQVISLGFFLSRSHRKWKELSLAFCHIGDHGFNLLYRYLCGDKTSKREITKIDLSYNDLTVASSPLIGDIITHLQPHTLMLSDNNITSVKEISTAVIHSNTVKVLHMVGNDLTEQESLSEMMTCLEKLYITDSKLGNPEALILSEGIRKTNTLRVLNISINKITATGATAIANNLIHNTSLEVLDMSNNAIGQGGAIAIAQATASNKKLKTLSLGGVDTLNEFSAMIIMRGLHYNNSINKLWLPKGVEDNSGNNIKREIKKINSARCKYGIHELKVKYSIIPYQ